MMHENQQAGMLMTTMMALGPERKEKTVKGDWCNLAKDSLTIKLIFSLEHKDGKL